MLSTQAYPEEGRDIDIDTASHCEVIALLHISPEYSLLPRCFGIFDAQHFHPISELFIWLTVGVLTGTKSANASVDLCEQHFLRAEQTLSSATQILLDVFYVDK